jgi:glucose-1-phosphate thymidylyltransferase
MDCGNKAVTVENKLRMLGFLQKEEAALVAVNVRIDNSTIIPPCYIGEEDVYLINSTVGPNVSLGKDAMLRVVQLKTV